MCMTSQNCSVKQPFHNGKIWQKVPKDVFVSLELITDETDSLIAVERDPVLTKLEWLDSKSLLKLLNTLMVVN